MNEHLMKYLYEWSDYINLENSKLKPKWISFIQEDSDSKINKRDKERIGFVEAVLIKEVSDSSGKINEQQVENLITARKKTGVVNLRETIHRRTYIETARPREKNGDNKAEVTPTVSLLTPTYGKRFKYLSTASK